ncbi:MAG: hypothetical protein ACYDC3_02175 [Candidatus Binataceae bacterium]
MTRQVVEAGIHNRGLEAALGFITFSMVVIGWLVADLMYRQKRIDPARFSTALGGAPYRLVENKYYVDEFYAFTIVRPYMALTRALAWFDTNIIDGIVNLAATLTVLGAWMSGLFDSYVVDGLVDAASLVTLNVGARLRRLQTGSINGYLYGILAAVMVILLVRAMLRV